MAETSSSKMHFERMEQKILLSADALGGLVAADTFGANDNADGTFDLTNSSDLLNASYGSSAENIASAGLDGQVS